MEAREGGDWDDAFLGRLSTDELGDRSLGHPKSAGDLGLCHAVREECFDAGTSPGCQCSDPRPEAVHLLGDVGDLREGVFPVHAYAPGRAPDGKFAPGDRAWGELHC